MTHYQALLMPDAELALLDKSPPLSAQEVLSRAAETLAPLFAAVLRAAPGARRTAAPGGGGALRTNVSEKSADPVMSEVDP